MSFRDGKGSISLWAMAVSLVCHIVLFVVFSLVSFCPSAKNKTDAACVQIQPAQIKRIVSVDPIVPKPKIKKILGSNFSPSKRFRPDLARELRQLRKTNLPAALELSTMPIAPNATIAGSQVEFFGQASADRKICFVVDCSASMHGMFGQVKKELKASIANLTAEQYFYIIFFRGEKLIQSGRGDLVRATPKTKADAYKFIDNAKLGGTTEALKALNLAMKIRDRSRRPAEVIYFLTDGLDLQTSKDFARQVEILRKKLAPATKFITIGFWTETSDATMLKEIAARSGGKFVDVR